MKRIMVASLMTGLLASCAPQLAVIHSFADGDEGALPDASLIVGRHGVLFGTTKNGGTSRHGTVFSLTPPGAAGGEWTAAVLHSFAGGSDGSTPFAPLVTDDRGALYGTTTSGGATGACSCGIVFRLTPPEPGETAWRETVLYRFAGAPDGAHPYGGLIIDGRGVLYGTTVDGGVAEGTCGQSRGCGTVFKLTPPADGAVEWSETVLYRFTGRGDGEFPQSALVMDTRGALYGTTIRSGVPGEGSTVFRLMPPTDGIGVWSLTVVQRFRGANSVVHSALTIDSAAALYGTVSDNKPIDSIAGTVFKLIPPVTREAAWTKIDLRHVPGGNYATVIADKEGALYGTGVVGHLEATAFHDAGRIFKLSPPPAGQTEWTETLLFAFPPESTTHDSFSALVADEDGALYGTTSFGGSPGSCRRPMGCGTVYKLTRTGFAH
jgi:uncharacterized repeat protein (TIGR03803 family)